MPFRSILFENIEEAPKQDVREEPAFFADLNLDQMIEAITAGKREYDLKPFYYESLNDAAAVRYRQEIMRDLEDEILYESVQVFSRRMRAFREYHAQADKLSHRLQKEEWVLEAVETYGETVAALAQNLARIDIRSRGLSSFREYLMGYVESDRFTTLRADTKKLRADLAAVRYCLRIQGNRIDVRLLGSERDYAEDVERTFERLKRGSTKDYTVDIPDRPGMNHVEEGILDLVAQLYPDVFSALDEFCGKYRRCLEEIIRRFDREIQFYVAYLDHIARFKKAGLAFCYPEYSHESREIRVSEGYDLALADRLLAENGTVVCNDFGLKGNERVLVVTGPNQGGKTTFARAFGQIHHLASLGCPVPAREAKLAPFDKLFTHFEKEETRSNLRGKLQDDLLRMRDILSRASSASVVIINEILSSTTLHDALFLGLKLMERIVRLGPMCVYVTFIDELATYSEETVSMVGAVVPDHPDVRTYKIQRRPPDGLSHALSLAAKRRLTYTLLKERLLP